MKSPSTTQGVLYTDKFVNNLSRMGVNAVRDRLGDLYNSATCMWLPLGNSKVADTASIPLVANLCKLVGCIWLGTYIITPPLFSHVSLSHLMSTISFLGTRESCEGFNHVSQKHNMLADIRLLSDITSGNLATSDLTFNPLGAAIEKRNLTVYAMLVINCA